MSEKEVLLEQVPLIDFFRKRVQTALTNHKVQTSDILEFYLVNLLQEFRKTEKLFQVQGSKMTEKPLALILADAVEGDASTRIRSLKQLGDVSLYTAGFFAESISRRTITIGYYIRMGGGAYQSLAQLLSNQKTFAELYAELSKLFPNLVSVLSEVAHATHWNTDRDLLKLYERWLATGDQNIENLLNQAGIQTQEKETFNKPQ
ncbi:MAG: hypothetical protein A3H42_04150 [Deltaproteobacteria bacterium RIFCSPLOWO2_02_FULL_46_8]|nr:MAG: hypothetical protein A3H42_04150 [Deltaproteobacteria bacterium RIFCSPLOWO2_02_FULL_46_8]